MDKVKKAKLMKRILLLAALMGAVSAGNSAFAYDFVTRAVPNLDGSAPAPVAEGALPPTAANNPYEIDMGGEEAEEGSKFLSGSIVGTWEDGHEHEGNTWNMEQVWLTSEREVDSSRPGLDVGYRIDALFGTNILQSSDGFDGKWGVSDDGYGASIYQAYGQLGYGKMSLKAGKFGTIIGYESVDASEEEFVTHSNMFNHEPATHMGGLFTWQLADTFSLDFGMVSGIDNSFANRRGDTGFLFGASLDLAENVSVSYAGALTQVHSQLGEDRLSTSYGYYDLAGTSIGDADEYLQTVTAEIEFTDRFSYAFTTNYGVMSDRAAHDSRYGQFGFANYFMYELTENLSTNVRYEYYTQWLDKAGKPQGTIGDVKQLCHDVSFSLKYKPVESLYIMPEIRYDWVETGDIKNKITEKENGVTGGVACGFIF